MLSYIQTPANALDPLSVETWAATRALDRKGPVAEWLAPKAAAARAPLRLVHTALVFEISAALIAEPGDASLSKRADALIDSDLDRLILRAATMVQSVRLRTHYSRARQGYLGGARLTGAS